MDEAIESWAPYLLSWKQLPDGRWAGVHRRMYNTQILIGLTTYGYRDAY